MSDLISEIKEAQTNDANLQTLILSVKGKDNLPPSLRRQYEKYTWEDDLLWYEGRVIIPDDKDLRLTLLEQHHDSSIVGHQGQARTL